MYVKIKMENTYYQLLIYNSFVNLYYIIIIKKYWKAPGLKNSNKCYLTINMLQQMYNHSKRCVPKMLNGKNIKKTNLIAFDKTVNGEGVRAEA